MDCIFENGTLTFVIHFVLPKKNFLNFILLYSSDVS